MYYSNIKHFDEKLLLFESNYVNNRRGIIMDMLHRNIMNDSD